jgi:hypothetical protein
MLKIIKNQSRNVLVTTGTSLLTDISSEMIVYTRREENRAWRLLMPLFQRWLRLDVE